METDIGYQYAFVFGKVCEILRHKTQNMPFAQLNISILPENATVDFPIVLLKILPVTCEHIFYIQNHTQPSLFCETENLVRFRG